MTRLPFASPRPRRAPAAGSVDAAEVARFEALDDWWEEDGAHRPLHALVPPRIRFVRDGACARLGRSPESVRPLDGLAALDVGCGGGLLAEPLARLGADVVGIDASATAIEAARAHAEATATPVRYRVATAEALVPEGRRFDIVVCSEVIEHAADRDGLLAALCRLTAPGGILVVTTINRTARAFALAVVGAEYVLRWLPRGTHDWRRFVRPSEIAAVVRRNGLEVERLSGMVYDLAEAGWRLGGDLSVNYALLAVRPSAAPVPS